MSSELDMQEEALAEIRGSILNAIRDRDITKYNEMLPDCMGNVWGIVRATTWLCEQIKLKGVKLYVESSEGLWQWGLIDDDGLTSLSYGTSSKGFMEIATFTLVAALSHVSGRYGRYELYIIESSGETTVMSMCGSPSSQSAADLAQLIDELNIVIYAGSQDQVRNALRDIAAK